MVTNVNVLTREVFVLIKRVRDGTECQIGEEQCGFRQVRGCIDQVFAVRQVCEKYRENGKICVLGGHRFGKFI